MRQKTGENKGKPKKLLNIVYPGITVSHRKTQGFSGLYSVKSIVFTINHQQTTINLSIIPTKTPM